MVVILILRLQLRLSLCPLLLHLFVHHSSVAVHELLRSHGEDHNPRLTEGRLVIEAALGPHLSVSSLLVRFLVV